ncbi:MAG: DUF192 domain-containing protein, partial [Phycisphaerales bacterium]|nr:DUF192 domain-containing protein [Phycisphaerales bacterium]
RERRMIAPSPWLKPLFTLLWAMSLVLWPVPGCEEEPPPPGFERVEIGGRTFTLELALNEATRTQGLGGRESLPEKGGMLFVFKRAERRQFIMRDCLIDVDIIFLDSNGRIIAMHHMPAEPPRAENEGEAGDWDPRKAANRRYEARLTRYSSRGAAHFVIEIAGGELEKLDLAIGQQIELDTAGLKALAR